MPVRNVIFDFGGVLVRWSPQEIIDGFYADPKLRAELRTQVFQHPDWIEMDRGTIDEQAVIERAAARMRRPSDEMAALFTAVRASLEPIVQTVALLGDLRERGYRLYGLSNMSEPIFAHLSARNDFFGWFHGIVVSGAIKLVKPEPGIYEHLRTRYALDFAESVFIDDLPSNVASAEALGLAAIRFEDPVQVRRELLALL